MALLSIVALHAALLLVQVGMSGYQIITRVALTGGMSLFTFAVYRGAIGLCLLTPFAFFLERNMRPPLTWPLVGHFFLLGLTGVFLSQAFFLEGLSYTSPTFAAAIQNSIPAITFIIAAAFGQEKVHIKRPDGQAKVLGTTLCVIGATVMVFYKGPAVIKVEQDSNTDIMVSNIFGQNNLATSDNATSYVAAIYNPLPYNADRVVQSLGPNYWEVAYLSASGLLNAKRSDAQSRGRDSYGHESPLIINYLLHLTGMKSWQLGAFYLVGMCIAFSFWLVIQSPVIKQYPARLSVTAYTTFFGTLQLLILALWEVRDEPCKWVLSWGSELLSVLYAGLVVSGLVFSVQMWCVQKGGAVLTAVYQPAQTVIVAIFTFLFLKENFYLGSLIGGLLIIVGLYLVTWGQGKEKQINSSLPTSLVPSSIIIAEEKVNANINQSLPDKGTTSSLTQPLLNDGLEKENTMP